MKTFLSALMVLTFASMGAAQDCCCDYEIRHVPVTKMIRTTELRNVTVMRPVVEQREVTVCKPVTEMREVMVRRAAPVMETVRYERRFNCLATHRARKAARRAAWGIRVYDSIPVKEYQYGHCGW